MQHSINVVLIRHPQTEGNVLSNSDMTKLERPNHLFQPTEKGEWQVRQALRTYIDLKFPKPTALYCSTFLRTRVVVEAFHDHFHVPIIEDSRLNEKWDGIFHSIAKEDATIRYPEQIEIQRKYGWYHYSPPGGENGPTVELRIRSFFTDIWQCGLYESRTLVIGAHGNWLNLFEGVACNLPWQQVEENRKTRTFPNCSISVFDLLALNQFEQGLDRYAPWLKEEPPTTYA